MVDSVLVRHRTKEHGRRYAVSFKNKDKLEALVEGRAKIQGIQTYIRTAIILGIYGATNYRNTKNTC